MSSRGFGAEQKTMKLPGFTGQKALSLSRAHQARGLYTAPGDGGRIIPQVPLVTSARVISPCFSIGSYKGMRVKCRPDPYPRCYVYKSTSC